MYYKPSNVVYRYNTKIEQLQHFEIIGAGRCKSSRYVIQITVTVQAKVLLFIFTLFSLCISIYIANISHQQLHSTPQHTPNQSKHSHKTRGLRPAHQNTHIRSIHHSTIQVNILNLSFYYDQVIEDDCIS
jgi:hypothetical protein